MDADLPARDEGSLRSMKAAVRHRENAGNTARDHLANERTYLAWLRTGFGTVALGLGIAKLLGDPGEWIPLFSGIVFGVLGIAMLIYGTLRYYRVMRAIDEGLFDLSRTGPVNFGLAAGLLAAIVAGLLLLTD